MTISPAHRARYIAGSGISDAVADARGYRSVPTGLHIPSYDIQGNNGTYQTRLDDPVGDMKYATPAGQKVAVDVHPAVRERVLDASVPLWIVEGVRKADAGISHDYCCVAIPGANTGYMVNEDTGQRTLRTGFETIPLAGRKVYLCLDSDCWTTPEVYQWFRTLSRLLVKAGAVLYRVRLEPTPDKDKTGLDDYLVRGGSMKMLERTARRYTGVFEFDDTGMAEWLQDMFYPVIRFVPLVGWYVYNKARGCWEHDFEAKDAPPVRVMNMLLDVTEEMRWEVIPTIEDKKAIAAATAKRHAYRQVAGGRAVTKAAQLRNDIRVPLESFDTDPEEINCVNGVLNLRTLTLTKHRPIQMYTDRVPVAYDPDAYHKEVDDFLDFMFPNKELRAAVFRFFGCAILGDNRAHKFGVIHGPSRAGKGTLLDLIRYTLNGYAKYTDADTWLRNSGTNKFLQRHMLRSARLVHSEELPKGARVDEAMLKNCTGGDPVQARTHYAEPYEYVPGWTLLINTNERPRMSIDDSGMETRYLEIPAIHAIPKSKIDPTFRIRIPHNPDAQRYMLRLLAEGAHDYLNGPTNNALRPAPEMLQATADAWRDQEPLAAFVRDACQVGESHRAGVMDFKRAYAAHCIDNKVRGVTGEKFEKSLKNVAPVYKHKFNDGWHWVGIRVTPDNPDEASPGGEQVFASDKGDNFEAKLVNPHVEKISRDRFTETAPILSLLSPSPADPSADAPPTHLYVTNQGEADWYAQSFLPLSGPLAIDIETTGLNPRTDRARLLTVKEEGSTPVIFDLDKVTVAPFWHDAEVLGHNLLFEFGFLPPSKETKAWDTMIATQVLDAGLFTQKGHYGLSAVAERFCGKPLEKAQQLSDWSGDLTDEQLRYAALDVQHLHEIKRAQIAHLDTASLMPTAELEMRALMGVQWLSNTGVPFDLDGWMELARENTEKQETVLHELKQYADINWNSPVQALPYFRAAGFSLGSTDEAALRVVDHPAARLLLEYRALAKATGTYGANWAGYVADGRVHAGWKQCFTATGRMSCAEPNLQNLPRDARVRACFRAGDGRVLVSADYAQIEARVAAVLSGDPALIALFQSGKDVYSELATQLTGRAGVVKGDPERQMAKSAVLGLLFGMGNDRFISYCRNGVPPITEEMADDIDLQIIRDKFFKTFPRLRQWQREQGADEVTETFTLGGRRRQDQKYYSEKLNAPVQGTAADGMKAALARLWEESEPNASVVPVLCIHDSLTVECDENDAGKVARWLETVMVEEMQKIVGDAVPIKVDVVVGKEWH